MKKVEALKTEQDQHPVAQAITGPLEPIASSKLDRSRFVAGQERLDPVLPRTFP